MIQNPGVEHKREEVKVEMTEEQIAQMVLRRLQDEKIANSREQSGRMKDPNFEKEEKAAQDALRRLQDSKIKK